MESENLVEECEKLIQYYGIVNERLTFICDRAKDYAISKGILMRSHDLSEDTRVLLPFCLLPSLMVEKWFHHAHDLQLSLNSVLFKVSHSIEFLKECLASTIEADDFTANIFRIFEQVESEEDEQLSLGLIRSDYLLDCGSHGNVTGIKQVENNTIASSFGGLAPHLTDIHRYMLNRIDKTFLKKQDYTNRLPKNESLDGLAEGIIAAFDAYNKPRSIILFVVEEFTSNICDQRAVEHKILELRDDIEIVRCTFKELRNAIKLKDKVLLICYQEVAVVYYRTGYMPDHYEAEDWDTRLLIERSKAVKCPSAGLHLAGTKRVQLQLSRPGVLEQFIEPDVASKLRQVFVNQYSLEEGEEGDRAINLGIENPDKFVLKPEREGGGNNVYGADIRTVLESIKSTNKRNAYILMERIKTLPTPNIIVHPDKIPVLQRIISELGFFGVILGDKKSIKLNKNAGHLLRSKESFRDETGVAAGFGALDSPLLM